MNGVPSDKIPLVGWWDALDAFWKAEDRLQLECALQMARECQHEDAKWLASLFPAGVAVTRLGLLQVMREQGDDPRALLLQWLVLPTDEDDVMDFTLLPQLRRAAEAGYAPAQGELSHVLCGHFSNEEAFEWAERAAAQGHRDGLFDMAAFVNSGVCCEEDAAKALSLMESAAVLGHVESQFRLGSHFEEHEWERYRWWGRAVRRGMGSSAFVEATMRLFPLFEARKLGRVLFEVAPVLRESLDVEQQSVFGRFLLVHDVNKLQRVVELFDARCTLAKRAIDCWSAVGRRLGVVKDIRVVIAKLAWEERWRWFDADEEREAGSKKGRIE